jgi:hypothetical protein
MAAGDRTNTQKSLQIDVALLKQQTSVLEQTVVAQNAAMNTELSKMNGVLKEIHDKLDKTILSHTVELTVLKASNEDNKTKIEDTNTRITRTSTFFGGLITAIVGGIASWLKFGSGT